MIPIWFIPSQAIWLRNRSIAAVYVGGCLGRVGLAALLLVFFPATLDEAAAREREPPLQASDERQPTLWLSTTGCDPGPVEGACARIPDLLVQLEGVDPAAYTIHVSLGDDETTCQAPQCAVALLPTSPEGVEIRFWAESPSANRKVTYSASVRVLPTGDIPEKEAPGWYVQVLSTQWLGEPVDTCAVAWDTFPPVTSPPGWLATPEESRGLATSVAYHYLSARLIQVGAVHARECPDGGLTQDGAPSPCGIEKANPAVHEWQNQFDQAILNAALTVRIPGALVKRVISEESQFWPGSIAERGEYGLGHLTELGADNTLLWNREFYATFCPAVLGEPYCGRGYAQQSDYRRGLLRGALLASVDSDCTDCEWGVDLVAATEGVTILTESLRAYCAQTGRMVSNVTMEAPGRGSTYEDMWKLTLAGYAAGPGCVAQALKATWRRSEDLEWESVSAQLSATCSGAVDYVEHLAR